MIRDFINKGMLHKIIIIAALSVYKTHTIQKILSKKQGVQWQMIIWGGRVGSFSWKGLMKQFLMKRMKIYRLLVHKSLKPKVHKTQNHLKDDKLKKVISPIDRAW